MFPARARFFNSNLVILPFAACSVAFAKLTQFLPYFFSHLAVAHQICEFSVASTDALAIQFSTT